MQHQNQNNLPSDRKALLREALIALEKMQAKLDATEKANSEPVAVVGLGLPISGLGSIHLRSYWHLLENGLDAV